jgi:SAM-dependent methyltransferase
MNKSIKLFYRFLKTFGLDPLIFINSILSIPFFVKDYYKIRIQKKNNNTFFFGNIFPILNERFQESGTMSGHYFHQDILIARKIFINKPIRHLDIGSRTDGFVAHVSVFREIEVIDIREQKSEVKNIHFTKANLMELPIEMINYCDSISSLHAIEHFGLGRYGDPIDYFGYLKAIENIHLILQPNGKFYFSTPIGTQRIEFNAHRVFSISYLINLFEKNFYINEFSYVDDKGNLFENISLSEEGIMKNYNCNYGCGIFILTKK